MACSWGDFWALRSRSGKKYRRRRNGNVSAGFSLLEVLIALSILAILGAVTVRGVHEGQESLARSRWNDLATLLGRNLLYAQTFEGHPGGEGSFAPQWPEIRWRVQHRDFGEGGITRTVVLIWKEQGTQRYEIRLETFEVSRTLFVSRG